MSFIILSQGINFDIPSDKSSPSIANLPTAHPLPTAKSPESSPSVTTRSPITEDQSHTEFSAGHSPTILPPPPPRRPSKVSHIQWDFLPLEKVRRRKFRDIMGPDGVVEIEVGDSYEDYEGVELLFADM